MTPGTKLGPYEVLAPLGAGGMGEVWKARDTRLDRIVAIKIAKEQFSERFEREARLIASLNHPHICTLYDVGPNYLVMEYIEGTPLKGPLPFDQALRYAIEICEALEAAHRKLIIHRDLKPANIMVNKAGVKVLDFGLAKIRAKVKPEGATLAPTVTMGPTKEGAILGTLQYMSPEQAEGQEADARSDIFSFGAVLYEMLTGRKAFEGKSAASVLASVMKGEPVAMPELTGALDPVLRRCLAKDPEERWQSASDLKWAIENLQEAKPQAAPPVQIPTKKPRLWMAAAMAVLAGVALWGWLKPAPAPPRPLIHFITATPRGIVTNPVVVSPDGSRAAFVAGNQVYLRSMDDPAPKPVLGAENARFPTFSPDGQWLAFFGGTAQTPQLKKVPIAGGATLTLTSVHAPVTPMSWGEDGTILLGGTDLERVPEAGGQPAVIAKLDASKGEVLFLSPELLPGGKYILATVVTTKGIADPEVMAVAVGTGKKKVLLEDAGECLFAPTGAKPSVGHLVYARNESLFAAAFNAATLQVGPAAPVLGGVRNLAGLNGAGLSRSGTLAYASGQNFTGFGSVSTLMWVDRQGVEQPLTAPTRRYLRPQISPDGGRIAFAERRACCLRKSPAIMTWLPTAGGS